MYSDAIESLIFGLTAIGFAIMSTRIKDGLFKIVQKHNQNIKSKK